MKHARSRAADAGARFHQPLGRRQVVGQVMLRGAFTPAIMANRQTAVLNNRFFIAFPPSGRTNMRKAYEVVESPGPARPGCSVIRSVHGRSC